MQNQIVRSKPSVLSVLKGDWLLMACLCFSVSAFSEHSKLFIIPAFFILLSRKAVLGKNEHSSIGWLFVFSLSYLLPYFFNLEISSRSDYLVYLTPPLFFMAGCYIGMRYKYQEEVLLTILYILLFFYAIVHFIKLIRSGFTSAEELIVTRMVLSEDGSVTIAATLYAIYMSMLIVGLVFIFAPSKPGILKWIRIFGVLFGLLATWGMMTIVTRTSVLEAAVMIVLSLFMMLRERHQKRTALSFVIISIILLVGVFYVYQNSSMVQIMDAYQSRNELAGHGLNTFGDRETRWLYSILDILVYPFGTPTARIVQPGLNGSFGHNMWLDVGLTAGWLPLIILSVFSIRNIRQTYKLWKDRSYNYYTRLFFFAVLVMFLLSSFVEPILGAVYSHFLVYLIFCGIVSELTPKQVKI